MEKKKKERPKGLYVEVGEYKSKEAHMVDVAEALREFTRKVKRSEILKDLRKKEAYVKPSVKKRLKRNSAIHRSKFNLR